MHQLVEENLGRVACPVCGTEYDDTASACPKCGAMGLASKQALIKGEGRPVPLSVQEAPPPRRAQLTPLGLSPAQGNYPMRGQVYIRPKQEEPPALLWLGIIGFFLGFGGMMVGMMWFVFPGFTCQIIGFSLDIAAIGIGVYGLKKGSKMAIGAIVIGLMALFITLLLAGIFWMVGLH